MFHLLLLFHFYIPQVLVIGKPPPPYVKPFVVKATGLILFYFHLSLPFAIMFIYITEYTYFAVFKLSV